MAHDDGVPASRSIPMRSEELVVLDPPVAGGLFSCAQTDREWQAVCQSSVKAKPSSFSCQGDTGFEHCNLATGSHTCTKYAPTQLNVNAFDQRQAHTRQAHPHQHTVRQAGNDRSLYSRRILAAVFIKCLIVNFLPCFSCIARHTFSEGSRLSFTSSCTLDVLRNGSIAERCWCSH